MNNRSNKRHHDQQHPRHDQRTREVVDQAIAAMPDIGLQQAAEFLSAMKVPPEVAVRTLVYPHKRRS